jgi:hypothetical protein
MQTNVTGVISLNTTWESHKVHTMYRKHYGKLGINLTIEPGNRELYG